MCTSGGNICSLAVLPYGSICARFNTQETRWTILKVLRGLTARVPAGFLIAVVIACTPSAAAVLDSKGSAQDENAAAETRPRRVVDSEPQAASAQPTAST